MMGQRRSGHSLIELLVCLAIISILMAMYLPALAKARKQAEGVVVREGFRQEAMGRMAGGANIVGSRYDALPTSRQPYRVAYLHEAGTEKQSVLVTEILCEVGNEAEFRAYWHTVIDPSATEPLEFRDGRLVARDETGKEYLLGTVGFQQRVGGPIPVRWEFLSTNLAETSAGTIGTSVLYSDGHVEYVHYPGPYPACPSVAELSHAYVMAMQ